MQRYTFSQVKQTQEYNSFVIRSSLGAFATIFCGLALFIDVFDINFKAYLLIAISFQLFSFIFLLDIFRQLESPLRRYLTLFTDITYASLTIIATGGESNIIWLFYIWLFIGYGSRYGEKYLFAAQKISIIQYTFVVYLTDIWLNYPLDLGAQFVVLFLLPRYILSMIQRLHEARQNAENLAKIKSNFLTSMSHEIRTPLNGIIGTTILLEKTKLDEEQKKYSTALLYSSELLLALINNILDLAKIEENKFNMNEDVFSLKETVNRVVESFLFFSQSKGIILNIQIDSQLPHLLIGDKQRMNQILVNLIGNAIKFTEKGSVTVELKIDKESIVKADESILIICRVIDTGIGMSDKNLKSIFEKFTQFSKNSDELLTGTGLGMAITKELITLMNGSITVHSELNKGSEFICKLPFMLTKKELKDSKTEKFDCYSKNKQAKKINTELTVLIAEDDDINAMILGQFLNDLGLQFIRASDGKETLSRVKDGDFSLIFMDLHMPDMTGIEVTQSLRSNGLEIPIIGLTANATTEQKNNCLQSGMNDFITKPVTPDDIKQAILRNN